MFTDIIPGVAQPERGPALQKRSLERASNGGEVAGANPGHRPL